MAFYTNIFQRGNRMYVRGFDKGLRYTDVVNYTPYLFINKNGGKYRTLDGRPVEKLPFDSIGDAREFINRYEQVTNFEIHGLTIFPYLFIFDNFKGDIDYDPKLVNIATIDIECAADEGFPDIQRADKPITAITLRSRNRNYVFGCGDFHTDDDNTFYVKCRDEHELIQKFLECWEGLDLDVITGWNIEFFDIPYTVNRIKNLFGEREAKRLSPWRILDEKIVEFRGKENQSYNPAGISVLDYYQLYRKFMFGNQESYKLDFIAQVELGEKKIDYSEYGNLLELYKNNYQKFIEYNIHDTVLVDRLDDKLKFLEQTMALAYDAKVNYPDVMTTVRPWDIIIHNYLLEQGIVIPPMRRTSAEGSLIGGFVKEPKLGLSKWVVSFDLNSLYPHLIMQYNISPETFVGRMDMPSIERLLEGKFEYEDDMYAYAANGCMYRKDKQGFLPALMEKMYDDRTKYKKLMLEAKKDLEIISAEMKKRDMQEIEKLNNQQLIELYNQKTKEVARYHNLQMAKKIQLNSAYGALANQFFRWFSYDHAEAITMSGQLSIRWIERKMNQYMNKLLKTKDVDFVIASDTDSIYVCMDELVKYSVVSDELLIVDMLDKFCEQKIQPYLDKCYKELAEMMNAYQQKMQMKRETIANKGIWRGKKMYILNAWNVEGVQYSEPKLKLQGIEAVRSSTPKACRENIKKSLSIIMNGTQEELHEYIRNFHEEFMALPFEDVAFPRGVKGMYNYSKNKTLIYDKGTPIHVKGALIFNHLLKKHNIKSIPAIQDGDKIRFAYLKVPNPVQESVVAVPDELPAELEYLDKYIDRETQFKKSFLEPLNSITDVIGWSTEQRSTLEDFFND